MRLARRFTFWLVASTLLVLLFDEAVNLYRQDRKFALDMKRDHEMLVRSVVVALTTGDASDEGPAKLVAAVSAVEGPVTIRWLTPDAPLLARMTQDERRRLLASDEVVHLLDSQRLVSLARVMRSGALWGAVSLEESRAAENAFIRASLLQAVVNLSVVILVCALVAYLLGALFVGRPMSQLVPFARRVGGGDFAARLDLRQRDELGELASEMNVMAEQLERLTARANADQQARLQALQQLRHAERLATVGMLAAGIAHELGTPLGTVAGRARLIVDAPEQDAAGHARLILEQTAGITRIVRQLMDFARPKLSSRQRLELRPIAERAVELLAPMIEAAGVKVLWAVPEESATADVDPQQFSQALTNIAVNAVQAMSSGGELTITISREPDLQPPAGTTGRGPWVRIALRDTGPGMPPEVCGRVFEPFFTTKPIGEGTGLGLPVTWGIIQEHGGWIAVDSAPGNGSTFSIHLPAGA
jgi:two-component system NtrC family sensor kinase